MVLGIRNFLLLWPLFFVICCGLGYPTLKRYDPRTIEGLSDTSKYHAMTTGADTAVFREIFRGRVLVPFVARPFSLFAQAYLPTWNAGFFGLLIANALFCATTACLIVSIGYRLFNDLGAALVGSTLYLFNFTIPNLQLSGLVDAGEACFMAALILSLLSGRWFLLPLWAVLGALAKETFVAFSFAFAFTWWLMEIRTAGVAQLKRKRLDAIWIIALGVVGAATVMVVHANIAGRFRWPWEIANDSRAGVSYLAALKRCFTEQSFWYVFGWLIPLGVWRLRAFPKPWLASSLVTAVLAIALGMFINAGGTVGRPLFDIVGPLLSLSVALLITGTTRRGSSVSTGVEISSGQ